MQIRATPVSGEFKAKIRKNLITLSKKVGTGRYNIRLAAYESKAFLRLVNLSLADNTNIRY
ncbi:MAG: hypothetical protein WAM88_00345 [Nitrososphaeraceae archaeon]